MARPKLPFTRTAIATAIAGARLGGVEVAEVIIAPDGTIRVITTNAAASDAEIPQCGESPELRAAIESRKK